MHTWPLQDAKSRFSELVNLSLTDGPQLVTRRGQEAVVVLAAHEYRRITKQDRNLIDTLLQAPRGEPLELERSREPIRDVEL
jgi:prevent-host-death family protein